jgi:oxygen-dependent protoporphyrinogen oxidase
MLPHTVLLFLVTPVLALLVLLLLVIVCRRRVNATLPSGASVAEPIDVVVIGGGVAGLTAAYELATTHRASVKSVTLLEADVRCGGMLKSHKLANGASIELGPRSMRSVGSEHSAAVLHLIDRLGLSARLRVPVKGVAARRYVLLPDSGELYLMPVSLWGVILLGVKLRFWPTLLWYDLCVAPVRFLLGLESRDADPSVHEFLTARVGTVAATALGSALIHGVFAGDSRRLSMRCSFPAIARLTDTYGSLILGALADAVLAFVRPASAPAFALSDDAKRAVSGRLYSIEGGIQVLADTLVAKLRELPHVTLLTEARVREVELRDSGDVSVFTASQAFVAQRVVCAVPPLALAEMLPLARDALQEMPFADVTCVSLIGGERPLVPANRVGFGVLAARGSCRDALLLGVIFESCVFAPSRGEPATGVVTVMLGGSDERQRAVRELSDAEVRERALAGAELVGVARADVQDVVIQRWRNAIPQFLAHGVDAQRRRQLDERTKQGRVVLAGGAYGAGVGVPDCVGSGMQAAKKAVTRPADEARQQKL